jgi:hypothetical protein
MIGINVPLRLPSEIALAIGPEKTLGLTPEEYLRRTWVLFQSASVGHYDQPRLVGLSAR